MTEYDDDVDAELLAAVFAAARRWEVVTGKKAPGKVLRETLWFIWQRPRLPRPLGDWCLSPRGGATAFVIVSEECCCW